MVLMSLWKFKIAECLMNMLALWLILVKKHKSLFANIFRQGGNEEFLEEEEQIAVALEF